MQPQRVSPLLVAVAFLGALSGCISDDGQSVFLLEYQIVDLAPGDEPRTADPGAHCGTASRDGDTLTIGLWPDEERPDGPWLAVFPHLPDHWRPSYGGEPFKTTFPSTIDPQVHEDDTTLGTLHWDGGDGTMRLNGDTIPLPHQWSITGEDASWRADLTLSAWAGNVEVERYQGLCD